MDPQIRMRNWKSDLIAHLQQGELDLPLLDHDLLFAAPLLGQGLAKVLHLESNLGNDKKVFTRGKRCKRGKNTTKNKKTNRLSNFTRKKTAGDFSLLCTKLDLRVLAPSSNRINVQWVILVSVTIYNKKKYLVLDNINCETVYSHKDKRYTRYRYVIFIDKQESQKGYRLGYYDFDLFLSKWSLPSH
jgi:hypothetical protein